MVFFSILDNCCFFNSLKKIIWRHESCWNKMASIHESLQKQRCSKENLFWKYAANLQENTDVKCDFNKVFCNFTEIPLRYGYSPVNLLHIFRTSFYKNTYGRLLLLLSETVTIGKNFLNLSVTHSFNKQPVNKKPVVGKSNIKQFHMARTCNGI